MMYDGFQEDLKGELTSSQALANTMSASVRLSNITEMAIEI